MLEFKKARLDDIDWYREIADKANRKSPRIDLDASFGACYLWSDFYGTRICRFEDFILKGYFNSDKSVSFSFPYGTGDIEKAVRAIEGYCSSAGVPLVWGGVTARQAEILNEIYKGKIKFREDRDYAEYIYETEKLSTLSGRNLHSKRNHLNRFEASYSYSFEMINSENRKCAIEVAEKWCKDTHGSEAESLDSECCAIHRAVKDFDRLGFKGAIIKIDGKPAAMTIGEEISSLAFVTHFEKALYGYDGLYAAINCYFARQLGQYKYINREEDMGLEGLRKAKLSYKPAILLEQLVGVYDD